MHYDSEHVLGGTMIPTEHLYFLSGVLSGIIACLLAAWMFEDKLK